ncbi:hypothetical protein V8E51_018543 [Hyaloscypha variabilis]
MEITPTPVAWSPVTALVSLVITLRCSKSGLYKQALGILFSTDKISYRPSIIGLSPACHHRPLLICSPSMLTWGKFTSLLTSFPPLNPTFLRILWQDWSYKYFRQGSEASYLPGRIKYTLSNCISPFEVTLRFITQIRRGWLKRGTLSLKTSRADFYELLTGCQEVKVINVVLHELEVSSLRPSERRRDPSAIVGRTLHIVYSAIPQSFRDAPATISTEIQVQAQLVSQSRSIIHPPNVPIRHIENLERTVCHH